MPSEITAFIMPQTQTIQSIDISPDQENTEPGLFDAFISEYIAAEENVTEENAIENTTDQNALINTDIQPDTENTENTEKKIAFTGSNSFSRSVIDILADQNKKADITQDISAKIKDTLKDIHEDVKSIVSKVKSVVSEKISELELPTEIEELITQIINDESIPEETKNEFVNAVDELVNELKDSGFEGVKAFAMKLSDVIHEHIDAIDDPDIESEPEDTKLDDSSEVKEIPNEIPAGMTIIANTNAINEPEVPTENSQQAVIDRPVQHEIKTQNMKPQSKPELESESESELATQETRAANFNEHLEHASTEPENETSTQNQNQNQNQNAGQEEDQNEQSNQTQTASRTRNDSRRASSATTSRTQNERTESNSVKTESRNTFQSFFEGVLSNRRTASQSSPLPLNLQTASYTLSQSQTLRDGMINIIRFIRADGVQKANVVIDPPALGRISVELSSTSSGVEASIKVASEQIRQLVQDQISELRMNLAQQGVQVAEFTVDVQQDNSGNSNQQGSQYNEPRTYAFTEPDEESEEFRIDLEDGLLYWIA